MKVQAFNLPDFRDQGACTDLRVVPLDLHFPVGNTDIKGSPAHLQALEAKDICANCPVLARCRQWALETQQEWGVWGGLTERERRAMRRRSQQAEVEVPEQRHSDDIPATEPGAKLQEVAA